MQNMHNIFFHYHILYILHICWLVMHRTRHFWTLCVWRNPTPPRATFVVLGIAICRVILGVDGVSASSHTPALCKLQTMLVYSTTFSSLVCRSRSRMFFLVINALGLCRAGPLRRAGPIKKICQICRIYIIYLNMSYIYKFWFCNIYVKYKQYVKYDKYTEYVKYAE